MRTKNADMYNIDNKWKQLKTNINKAAESQIGVIPEHRSKGWWKQRSAEAQVIKTGIE